MVAPRHAPQLHPTMAPSEHPNNHCTTSKQCQASILKKHAPSVAATLTKVKTSNIPKVHHSAVNITIPNVADGPRVDSKETPPSTQTTTSSTEIQQLRCQLKQICTCLH